MSNKQEVKQTDHEHGHDHEHEHEHDHHEHEHEHEHDHEHGNDGQDQNQKQTVVQEKAKGEEHEGEIENAADSQMWDWIMLLLCCLSGIGCYMGQDIHTILARSFHNEIGLEKYDFDYLYSIIMFPNLILPFFGGYICDHYSGVKALVLFTAIITIGQFMAVVSVWGQSYWMFYVSRIVYALTKECVIVAVRLIITRWFYATFLGLAIGLPITIWRLFAIYAPFMYPGMMDTNGELDDSQLWLPVFVSALICLFSLGCAIGALVLENRKGRECVDYDYFEGEADEEKGKYVYHYSYMYKLLVFFAATGFACYYGYSNNTKIISQDVYNVEYEVTDIHFRIPFLIGALGIPIIGYIGDKYGQKPFQMVIASAFLMIGLALVGLEEFDITNCVNCDWAEFWPLLCFSLHFAIVSAISWVCISLVAGRELTSLIGQAHGLAVCIKNIFQYLITIIVKQLHITVPDGEAAPLNPWKWVILFLFILSVFLLALNIVINILDHKKYKHFLSTVVTLEYLKQIHEEEEQEEQELIRTQSQVQSKQNIQPDGEEGNKLLDQQ